MNKIKDLIDSDENEYYYNINDKYIETLTKWYKENVSNYKKFNILRGSLDVKSGRLLKVYGLSGDKISKFHSVQSIFDTVYQFLMDFNQTKEELITFALQKQNSIKILNNKPEWMSNTNSLFYKQYNKQCTFNANKIMLHAKLCGHIKDKSIMIRNGFHLDNTKRYNSTMRRICSMYQQDQQTIKQIKEARKKATILKYNKFRLPSINAKSSRVWNTAPQKISSQSMDGFAIRPPPKNSKTNNLGFAVGGAVDIGTFRRKIQNNRMPIVHDITFEGIYNEYYFDTDTNQHGDDIKDNDVNKNDLFYPSYCYAISTIPYSLLIAERLNQNQNQNINKRKNKSMIDDNDIDDDEIFNVNISDNDIKQKEIYMTVGLNSNISMNDFKRKKLNLIILLDISGSMRSSFNNDRNGESKMSIACKAILSLIQHLDNDDRIGLILFDHNVYIEWELQYLVNISINQIRDMLYTQAKGGTNFEIGYKACIKMFDKYFNSNPVSVSVPVSKEYDNRIMILTDMCPNIGNTSPNSLLSMVQKHSNKQNKTENIYTTFIGVGLDFNTELVSKITKIRGANYFAVHNNKDFIKKMDDEFEFIVSPLVFNLKLTIMSEGNKAFISKIYGSDSNNDNLKKNGEIMSINTLFPSPKDNDTGDTKGGIVLLKIERNLKKNNKKDQKSFNMVIECEYEDKYGKKSKNQQLVCFGVNNNDYYDNNGIHKAILLARYVKLIRYWIKYEKSINNNNMINVCKEYKKIFQKFQSYFKKHIKMLGDNELNKESDILNKLVSY